RALHRRTDDDGFRSVRRAGRPCSRGRRDRGNQEAYRPICARSRYLNRDCCGAAACRNRNERGMRRVISAVTASRGTLEQAGRFSIRITTKTFPMDTTTNWNLSAALISRAAPELTVILPTYNERENIPIVIDALREALRGVSWEVIVVDDDSPDGTSEVARALAEQDTRIRVIRRIGRRGLSGACLEGFLASSSRFVAVMDADMQHD